MFQDYEEPIGPSLRRLLASRGGLTKSFRARAALEALGSKLDSLTVNELVSHVGSYEKTGPIPARNMVADAFRSVGLMRV